MNRLNKCNNIIISLYLFVMLGFFPLFYRYQYADMGDSKYKIFLYASSVCVVISFLLYLCKGILSCYVIIRKHGKKRDLKALTKEYIKRYICSHPIDVVVLVYFCTTMVSFLFTEFKAFAFRGSDGWSMGFLSQALFVAIYFILAKGWKYDKMALGLLSVSSVIVFVIAVFHRFDLELIPIYGDLQESYKVEFLSTMGQASWYSSFLCTVFPIGLYVFFVEKDKKKRTLAGIYSAIAMMSLVTQNTDSAFLSLFVVMMVLFYLSFDGRIKEFLEVMLLVLASFCFMGLCQRIFAERMIPLDGLSLFMSQSLWVWIGFALVAGIYLWICKKGYLIKSFSKKVFWTVLIVVLLIVLLVILFIVLNTSGWLQNTFGYQSTNNYLLFGNPWGNGRGFTWKFSATLFVELPFLKKMFGVGPDCFSAYVASISRYSDQVKAFWGNLILTNAHNEYLTKLCNIGFIGLVSYIVMLVTAVGTFIMKRKENPFLPAFALCVVSYMAHNVFCYEQVCCTPFFYILMGIGSNLIHNCVEKSTY